MRPSSMKKRAIVTESSRPPKRVGDAPPLPPLLGAAFETAAAEVSQLPQPGPPELAVAGRSNSGKSSAINALARQTRLAYTSRTPGRTQQIVFFTLRGGGRLADLPGYGYAAVPRAQKESWQEFLWHYVTSRSTLIGLVLVVDARHGLRPMDEDLLEGFLPSGRPVLLLATKTDKLTRAARDASVAAIARRIATVFPRHATAVTIEAFSASTRVGVEAADRVLASWLPASSEHANRPQ
jgi:GTP-binding protein